MSVESPVGSLTTQGDITHAANIARATYGANGTGVRVGVLSDSAEATNFLIGTGDLPAGTTIVQEIINGPGSSEGTAMMEIVSDLAPGAQLFFASAFNGVSSFAQNIRLLRSVYHCDIIVDDVSYSDESPFQDDVIAQAVNDVTALEAALRRLACDSELRARYGRAARRLAETRHDARANATRIVEIIRRAVEVGGGQRHPEAT